MVGAAAAQTPIERALASVWSRVLERADLDPDADFFAQGGTSLEALRMMTEAGTACGLTLPVQLLFDHPTLTGLAEAVEGRIVAEVGAGRQPSTGAAHAGPPALTGLLTPAGRRVAAALDPERVKLLAERLRRIDPSAGGDSTPPRDHRPAPISYQQLRAWRRHLRTPDDPVASLPAAIGFDGAFAVPAFDGAVADLARRHEMLRTRFAPGADEEPQPGTDPAAPLRMPLVDLGGLAPDRADAVARALARREENRPFDLESAPAWRARLLRLGPERHVVLLTVHEIAADAWSTDVMGHETVAAYRRALSGSPPAVPEPAVRYADWARGQREWLESPTAVAELDRWRAALSGLRPVPPDRGAGDSTGGEVERTVPAAVVDRLKQMARGRDATLYMALVAVVQTLVHQLSGVTDVAIGCPAAGRDRTALDSVIGPFVNPLVLRGDLSGDPCFRYHLDATRARTMEAYAHHAVPYERVVEACGEGHPLFDVALSFHRVEDDPASADGIAIGAFQLPLPRTTLSLELTFFERDHQLRLALTHRLAAIDPAGAERIADALVALLEAAGEHPLARVSELGRGSGRPDEPVAARTRRVYSRTRLSGRR